MLHRFLLACFAVAVPAAAAAQSTLFPVAAEHARCPATGSATTRWQPEIAAHAITVADPAIGEVMEQMERAVPEWRTLWDTIRADDLRVLVGTVEMCLEAIPQGYGPGSNTIAIAIPIARSLGNWRYGPVTGVAILIDTARVRAEIRAAEERFQLPPDALRWERAMIAILVHETMHLDSYRRTRDVEGGCEDPDRLDRILYADSCVMRAQRPWLERFGIDPFTSYGVVVVQDLRGNH